MLRLLSNRSLPAEACTTDERYDVRPLQLAGNAGQEGRTTKSAGYDALMGLADNSGEASEARVLQPEFGPGQVTWLDAARIAAAFAVVLLHVSAEVVTGTVVGSHAWWTGNVFDASVRWCVPVFVMISGALLLDSRRTDGAGSFYRTRYKRLLVPLSFWTAVYLLWRFTLAQHAGAEFRWAIAVKDAVRGVPYYHLWFLFMMVGLYLFAPAIRTFVRNSTRRELWIFTCMMFVLSAVAEPRGKSLGAGMWLLWFLPYVAYFICGHLIATSERDVRRGVALIGYSFAVTLTAVGCYGLARARDLESGLYFYDYLSVSVIPMSVGVMWLFKSVELKRPAAQRITKVAGLGLGIYLVHPIFLDLARMRVRLNDHEPLVAIPLVTVLAFGVSALLCSLIKRMPLLRRTI